MIKNRELFLVDPTTFTIPNKGVAKIHQPETEEQWAVLRYELQRFVCEGEYRRGLERVLSAFLTNLNNPEQPAVWVSGFYGSGKSHFVRVLEYLWQDIQFPDGASARSLARLSTEINDQLKELTMAGRRAGGLWSAAGTLGASAGGNVRLALLAIVFRSMGLPDRYPLARFVLWLRQQGLYEAVKSGVEDRGKPFYREINNLYVSPLIADSLCDAYPGFAGSAAEARSLLKAQFPKVDDISDDEFLQTLEYVLELQSEAPGKLPLALIIFDELQQFIGEDAGKTLQVQTVVEACSARFGSRLLFVGTGQAALEATPQLSKLQDRFTVRVMLSDTDVDRVVREVVLRKAPKQEPALRSVLETARGEIDRHLGGTRIAPTASDNQYLVADYPLLPTRRRFWENTLRAIDPGGVEGQLRTQLRMVHEATRDVADRPVGTVVPADVIYDQQTTSMLQSGVLLPDLEAIIKRQDDGTPEGALRRRLCATIFLIGKLPTEGAAATGLKANPGTLADLLVQDLTAGSASLRQQIPVLLQNLVESGTLMLIGDEVRLQTPEGAEWEGDYRKRYARIRADDSRIASDRTTELRTATAAALKGITLTQGVTKTPRKFDLHFGLDAPRADSGAVPVWVRDEWSVSEKTVREDAQAAGTESPVVLVLLPRRESDALRDALAGHAAAKECVDMKPIPATPEGMEARLAMQSRQEIQRRTLNGLVANALANGRVYQGGGNEVVEGTLAASVRSAVEAALIRLFPRFGMADHEGWGKVVKRAQEGNADALNALGYTGDVDKHPVCQEVRAYLGSAGKKGSEARKQFTGVVFGWPQDAVDGALLALVAGGFVRAVENGQPRAVKELIQSQIGKTTFHREGVTVSVVQRIGVRKLITDLGVPAGPNEEAEAMPKMLQRLADLAHAAGGPPPLPERPSVLKIEELRSLAGNEQLVAVHEAREELRSAFKTWTQAGEKVQERQPRWQVLQQLLQHAGQLLVAGQVAPQVAAIQAERSLLAEPDPASPLLAQLADALRAALQAAHQRLVEVYQGEMARLEAGQEWQAIGQEDRQAILGGLGGVPPVQVSTEETLLRTLQASPLHTWEDAIAALPARFGQARMKAARLLEPKTVRVKPKAATLHSAAEVDAYLEDLRAEIMDSIAAGNPVIL